MNKSQNTFVAADVRRRTIARLKNPPPYVGGYVGLLLLGSNLAFGTALQLEINPRFSGEPLQPNSLRYETSAGETFSITRLSYLLSGFALQRANGSWLELTNQVAWLDMEKSRSSARLANVPPAKYRAIRFYVGLSAADNHADVAKLPPEHPLNPNLNGLHWSWQGGYVFLAVEGLWRNAAGELDGWSYHLARETNRTCINIGAEMDLEAGGRLELDFDLATLLNAPRPLAFGKDGSSTHSRPGDPIAAALVANLPAAFQLRHLGPSSPAESVAANGGPLYLPAHYTPYRFQMSPAFPIPELPQDNPLIEERVALGEKLFHDPALSGDNTVSCASCHEAKHAFSDPRRFSVGVGGKTGARHAMPLLNLAWKNVFFWDGRAPSLRAQALMPIQDHLEMDEKLTNVVAKLSVTGKTPPGSNPESRGTSIATNNYPVLFNAAFGSPEITAEKIGLAIESFVLTLTSFDSKFDRVLRGEAAFTRSEQRGFELFMTEYDPRREQFGADCFHCHGGPLFQSQSFANDGLDSDFKDVGRAKVTGKDSDKGKFATPSLRNVALTGPYMHDGRFATLEEVVEHYSTGVKRSATLDPNLAKHPDGGVPLSVEDKKALVAFLKTLTDERFTSNVAVARVERGPSTR